MNPTPKIPLRQPRRTVKSVERRDCSTHFLAVGVAYYAVLSCGHRYVSSERALQVGNRVVCWDCE